MVARAIIAAPTRYGTSRIPSHRRSCDRCGQDVWLSNRADVDDSTIICVVCAMAVIAPGDVLTLAPWVEADRAAVAELDPSAEL